MPPPSTPSTLRPLATGRWPESADDGLPPLAGFTVSTFNPLVAEAAERCLRSYYGPAPGPGPTRTALLLASGSGDRVTAAAIESAAVARRRFPPLLFFQSNPNAVLGHIAARWQLTGPVLATCPTVPSAPGGVPPDALEQAALLLADGDADQVLLIAAEQAAPDDRNHRDHAVALLLTQH